MENLKNIENKKLLAAIVLILVIGGGIYINKNKTTNTIDSVDEQSNTVSTTTATTTKTTTTSKPKTTTTTTTTTTNTALSGKCNLKITSPVSGAKVSFPLTIKGIIDNTNPQAGVCSWNEVARKAGTAELFSGSNNSGWKPLGIPVTITTTGTVASTSAFSVTLNFFKPASGLPSGALIKIHFIEFPLNIPNPDAFDFYVYLK